MRRANFLLESAAAGAVATVPAILAQASQEQIPDKIAGVMIPDSKLARDAISEAREVESAEVFRHSLRSFLFAELIAQKAGVDHDSELVLVAAILHDIGLYPKYEVAHHRFEVDGANRARAILTQYGKSERQTQLAWDAITLHSVYSIARFKEPEVQLVSAGVITDVGAVFASSLERAKINQIFEAAPRTKFNEAFLDVLTQYAHQKPDTVSGTFVEDVAIHTVPGYRAGDFYDEMKQGDAFSQLGFNA